jgi:hypothetical protein
MITNDTQNTTQTIKKNEQQEHVYSSIILIIDKNKINVYVIKP